MLGQLKLIGYLMIALVLIGVLFGWLTSGVVNNIFVSSEVKQTRDMAEMTRIEMQLQKQQALAPIRTITEAIVTIIMVFIVCGLAITLVTFVWKRSQLIYARDGLYPVIVAGQNIIDPNRQIGEFATQQQVMIALGALRVQEVMATSNSHQASQLPQQLQQMEMLDTRMPGLRQIGDQSTVEEMLLLYQGADNE